jgi:hypothetical protein
MWKEYKRRRELWCEVLTLGDGNLERTAVGKSTACWQATFWGSDKKASQSKTLMTDVKAEAGGERRHFDIPSSQRKVTVRSEVSFDDDKKKENTRSNGRRERRVSSELRRAVEAVERNCMFSPWEKATELADILCGATLKLTTQSSIDDRSIDRWRRWESDRAQWRRLKEFAEARLVGGERRHFDIPSSQRKVTVRSEVSFDDDKKKEKYTFERTSGAQGEQWIDQWRAVEAVERKCMFSPLE